jgi:hypothetical protein
VKRATTRSPGDRLVDGVSEVRESGVERAAEFAAARGVQRLANWICRPAVRRVDCSPDAAPADPLSPVIGAEVVAASAVTLLATAILSGYLTDWIGLTIAPLPTLVVSVAAAAVGFGWLWRRTTREPAAQAFAAFVAIVAAVLGWLLWLAGRALLPPGTGPDLTHHLLLIGYIEQHWRLPHDPQLGAYLGEMVDYTAGSQLLAALAGAWTRTDGLHAVYPLVAFTVALKSGIVFLIARRLISGDASSRIPFAAISVLLLLLPRAYFVGSFAQNSFLAQVVSECFVVAMWWALIVWDEQPAPMPAAFFALFGAATYLTWPVWIGPPLVVLAICLVFRRDLPSFDRVKQFGLAVAPICLAAALHSAGRTRSFGIVAVAGFVLRPAPAVFGWAFLLVCGGGVSVGLFNRRTRTIPLMLGAIALQAEALAVFAHSRGTTAPYMALKMVYLAIYPLAVAGTVGLAALWRAVVRGSVISTKVVSPAWRAALVWLLVAGFGIAAARSVVAVPRPTSTISEPLLQAGRWARTNVHPGCVDYLVADGYSAYWLHLAVLGNARSVPRSTENNTYEPRQAVIRWIEPGGLPYAIVEDFNALPKDIRGSVDIVARFDRAAVVQRRGPAACPQ